MGHIERRQKEKEQMRKSIMETALNIGISEGWNAVTVRKIAEKIDYTPPIVYEYFTNKQDLFNELAMSGHRELHKAYKLAMETEPDPEKIILQLSANHWDFAFEHNALYKLMVNYNTPMTNDEIIKDVEQIQDLFFKLTKERESAKELMFNWFCLVQGYIFNTIQTAIPLHLLKDSPKNLLIKAVERLINSI